MKKILVIVNKNWETEPVLNALTNPKLRPAALPFPEVINTPRDGDNRMSVPRAEFTLNQKDHETVKVVVHCIEDLMATGVNTSSSLEKYKVLPQAIAAVAADLIISVSTANHPDLHATHNGTVILGGNFFIYDGICEGASTYTAVGSINVTDYSSYDTIDKQALEEFAAKAPEGYTANSIETTHGVVKISTHDEPIIFLSPITDRLNHFNEDVTDTQNYVAAFNGGLALGELLCALAEYDGNISTKG